MPTTPINDRYILPGEQRPIAAYTVEAGTTYDLPQANENRLNSPNFQELFLHVAPAVTSKTDMNILSLNAQSIAASAETHYMSYTEAKQIVDLAGQWLEFNRHQETKGEYGLVS